MPTKLPDAHRLARSLVERFGVSLAASDGTDASGDYIELRPVGVHPNEGFSVRLTFGWRSVRADFVPGPWAASLVREMGLAELPKRKAFAVLAQSIFKSGGQVELSLNGSRVDPREPTAWSNDWSLLALAVSSGPIDTESLDATSSEQLAKRWAESLLGLALLLLPIEEDAVQARDLEVEGLPEGAKVRVEVNRYERSRVNRAVCVSIYGSKCTACGLDFASRYGELGEGYIHVHHVVPVSKLGAHYVVNPATDLVPLCANCHAMVHRRAPPITLDELQELLRRSSAL